MDNENKYCYKYPHAALTADCVVFGFDGESLAVLLIERGIEPFKGRWALPGGFMRMDETITECARRELLEETGYAGGEWRHFMSICANAGSMTNWSHTFIAEGVVPVDSQNLEATEDITIHLMSKQEVYELLKNGHFAQALMVAPLWRYFAENGVE